MDGSAKDPWGEFRVARRWAVLGGILSGLMLVATWLVRIDSGALLVGWLAVGPLIFWGVWRLERLRCPRCTQRFINLWKRFPLDSYRCPTCGVRVGEPVSSGPPMRST